MDRAGAGPVQRPGNGIHDDFLSTRIVHRRILRPEIKLVDIELAELKHILEQAA